MALENPLYLALKVENACRETRVQIVIRLPSPAGEQTATPAAERAQQTTAKLKRHAQLSAASRAAVVQHLPVDWTDEVVGQPPV
ncbi:hypothetical protein [Aestuariivita sp.]|uniref:hypothetical protein n=1 Tax=Aestuariivita sp. TaxID=1872407 RepID=UPI0025B7BA53|nr:hypothetical protein [Aestuariivita sp.]